MRGYVEEDLLEEGALVRIGVVTYPCLRDALVIASVEKEGAGVVALPNREVGLL